MVLDRFKELLNDYYTEPKDEEILGSFLAMTSNVAPSQPKKVSTDMRKKKRPN
jgi:hypothetical protein